MKKETFEETTLDMVEIIKENKTVSVEESTGQALKNILNTGRKSGVNIILSK